MKYRIRKCVTKKIVITEATYGHKYSKLEAKIEYYAQEKVMWRWWGTIGYNSSVEYFQYKDDCEEFIKQYHYLHYGMGIKYEIVE